MRLITFFALQKYGSVKVRLELFGVPMAIGKAVHNPPGRFPARPAGGFWANKKSKICH